MKTKESVNALQNPQHQKMDAKLRMFSQCDQEVNANRSLQNGNLAVEESADEKPALEPALAFISKFTPDLKKAKKVNNKSTGIFTNVLIKYKANVTEKIEGEITRKNDLVSAKVRLTDLEKIAADENVVGIERPRILRLSNPKVNTAYADFPSGNKLEALHNAYVKKNLTGRNPSNLKKQFDVIVGIIDVGGFDFAHPDFLNADGTTRFIRIWDQGGDLHKPPTGFNYGVEFTKEHMDKAIAAAKTMGAPATELEKQSYTEVGSHATHVTSIATGKSGAFPYAHIAAVSIAMKKGDMDRRKSFYDASCVLHAIEYLLAVAEEMKLPISINISLGTNGHAHDGSDATSRWINADLTLPGRCISIAAGNAGQEKGLSVDDYGYTMGRIHTAGKIEATGLSKDIFWTIPESVFDAKVGDISENEMEIWYQPQDRISVKLKPPGMPWIGPVKPGQFVENKQLADGSFISIYNDSYHFSNGHNYIGIYLSPNLKHKGKIVPITAGEWQVRLIGEEIRHGEFDGWIERDDPRPLGNAGELQLWNFPSFFAEQSNVDNSSISSLACAHNVIAVANCDFENETVNITSSQGPTRDKRNKPEVMAPGTNITAAKGFAGPDDLWISMTGTSMASPYVCGIAAWMLALEPGLSAAQIQGIIIRTSLPLPGRDYTWQNDSGFGLINPEACIKEAGTFKTKTRLE